MRNNLTKIIIPLFLLGCMFALMMVPVSALEFFLPINGADSGVFYKRLIIGLGFNFIFSFILAFALFIFPEVLRKAIFAVIAFACVIFVTASVLHFYIYKQLLAAPSLMVLLDTDLKEAVEFVGFYASGLTFSLGLITLLIMLAIATYAFKLSIHVFSLGFSKGYAIIALMMVLALGYKGWNKIYFTLDNPIPFVIQVGMPVVAQRAEYKKMLTSKPKFSDAKMTAKANASATHLIIIGESATTTHMSVYGYGRETNPNLKKTIQGFQMLLSQDTCSSRNVTNFSIQEIMLGSGEKLMFDDNGASPANLISVVRDAGYKTYWISNQPGAGYASLASFWSSYVDEALFLNKRDYRVGYDFDQVLLTPLENALKDESTHKVIVLHMMGSHPGYKQRYPKAFEYWRDADEVPNSVQRKNERNFDKAVFNAYDNSILYSDHIITEMLKLAKTYEVTSAVYFSDHGQNLGEKNSHVGHSTESGPRQGFEVPLIFWVNSSKTENLGLNFPKFKENLLKPYSLERIQYTLYDLYGVLLPDLQDGKSLFSENYQVVERNCDRMVN